MQWPLLTLLFSLLLSSLSPCVYFSLRRTLPRVLAAQVQDVKFTGIEQHLPFSGPSLKLKNPFMEYMALLFCVYNYNTLFVISIFKNL